MCIDFQHFANVSKKSISIFCKRISLEILKSMLLLSKLAHIHVMSRIFEPSISLKIVTLHISKQIRANIQGAHKNNTAAVEHIFRE